MNFDLTGLFRNWVHADGTGVGFDSSTGFTLPNGAKRSPDLAWVKRSRWESLTQQQREVFPPLCPDFVVELRSRSDALEDLQAKMREYLDNGAQLGWLIDPVDRKVYVYRPQTPVAVSTTHRLYPVIRYCQGSCWRLAEFGTVESGEKIASVAQVEPGGKITVWTSTQAPIRCTPALRNCSMCRITRCV